MIVHNGGGCFEIEHIHRDDTCLSKKGNSMSYVGCKMDHFCRMRIFSRCVLAARRHTTIPSANKGGSKIGRYF